MAAGVPASVARPGEQTAARHLHRGHELLDRARVDRVERELRVVQAQLSRALSHCESELALQRSALHGQIDVARDVVALALVTHCGGEIHRAATARGQVRIREAEIGERQRRRVEARVEIAGRRACT